MNHRPHVKIIAFVGLPGSGKSVAVDYLTHKGYPKVYFGGVVVQAVRDAGLEVNPENEQMMRMKLRQEEGNDVVVNRIVKQINDLIAAGQHHIVANGIYSWTEYKVMKRSFPGELTTVAIVAPKHIRHHRLSVRPERPLTNEEANLRDWSEIENLEKGGPIAIADHYIVNAKDLEHLHNEIDAICEHIEFYK